MIVLTYYDILGVDRAAHADDIRLAFKKCAQKYHPDRTGNDKLSVTIMKASGEARDTLLDPVKRAEYDRGLDHASDVATYLDRRSQHRTISAPNAPFSPPNAIDVAIEGMLSNAANAIGKSLVKAIKKRIGQ